MKKILLSLVLVIALCMTVPAQAEIFKSDNVILDTTFNFLKETNSGYFFPIAVAHKDDDNLEYCTSFTTTLASYDVLDSGQILNLDVGYVVENTIIAGVSYELGNLKKFSEIPVLDLINLSVGLFGSYDCEDGDAGIGINVRVIEFKF